MLRALCYVLPLPLPLPSHKLLSTMVEASLATGRCDNTEQSLNSVLLLADCLLFMSSELTEPGPI